MVIDISVLPEPMHIYIGLLHGNTISINRFYYIVNYISRHVILFLKRRALLAHSTDYYFLSPIFPELFLTNQKETKYCRQLISYIIYKMEVVRNGFPSQESVSIFTIRFFWSLIERACSALLRPDAIKSRCYFCIM